MRLDKLIPKKFLRYSWQKPVRMPPGTVPPKPLSSQGVMVIGNTPNGAAVAAGGAGAPDALRGSLVTWWPWLPIPDLARQLTINVYKTGDTVDPASVPSPAHAALGMTSVVVPAIASVSDVEIALQSCFLTWLQMLGVSAQWTRDGGFISFIDVVSPHLPLIISPRPAKEVEILGQNDCMLNLVVTTKATVARPYFSAGNHPGPWQIQGDAFGGVGVDRGQE
jgi:hypothetical protein